MLESRFNSPTVLLSILKTTEQGFEVLHPEVWFLKWLERLKPCFGGSFKVPGQGQASLLNMETKAVLLGFTEQEFKKTTHVFQSIPQLAEQQQAGPAGSEQAQLLTQLLLCEAGRTGCCSPLLPSGWPSTAAASKPNIYQNPFTPQPLTWAQLHFCFSLPAAPVPWLCCLGLRRATAAPHHSDGRVCAPSSPRTLGLSPAPWFAHRAQQAQCPLPYWLWLSGLNSKLVTDTQAESASNNHSAIKYTRLSSKYIYINIFQTLIKPGLPHKCLLHHSEYFPAELL